MGRNTEQSIRARRRTTYVAAPGITIEGASLKHLTLQQVEAIAASRNVAVESLVLRESAT
jgi:hypothetical protein